MGLKTCYNCGEKMISLSEKCPKCGIIPNKSMSPVWIGIAIAVGLLLIVTAGLIWF